MKKRILAAALCLALLSGCGARPPLDLSDAESDRAVIAYVPLDDRPDNVGRVEYLAESLGYVLKHNPGPGKAAIPASCTIGCWNRRHQAVTATFFPWTSCSTADWWPPVWRKPPQSVTACRGL